LANEQCPYNRLVILLYPVALSIKSKPERTLAHSIVQAQTSSIDNINHYTAPHTQPSPAFGTPHQAHINSGSNGSGFSPSAGAIIGPNTPGYVSPAPPPAAYYAPPGYGQQQGMLYNPPPPAQHPGMLYSAPQQPQQVFLGFVTTAYTSKPVYGPPGANFDSMGNVYIEWSDGSKQWVGPYRNAAGQITQNPNQRMEEDCCYQMFGYKGSY